MQNEPSIRNKRESRHTLRASTHTIRACAVRVQRSVLGRKRPFVDTSSQFVAGRTSATPENRMYSSISQIGAHPDPALAVRMFHRRRGFCETGNADAISKIRDLSKTCDIARLESN